MQKVELSDYQKVILQQIKALNPFYRIEYAIETIVVDGEFKLKFCLRPRGKKVNLVIEYDIGQDLYNAKSYLIENYGLDVTENYSLDGFFWDQLDDVFKASLK